jgi:crossover junction endodeoxyribonuclease RuvC
MSKIYVGIDPGVSGAIGIIGPVRYDVYDMPTSKLVTGKKTCKKTGKVSISSKRVYDPHAIARLIKFLNDSFNICVYLEKVHAMPGQGVTSMFSMGEGYGMLQGILSTLGVPFTLVAPQTWKKVMITDVSEKDKGASYRRAKQLFPDAALTGPKGAMLDGRCEALLIAQYGKWKEK